MPVICSELRIEGNSVYRLLECDDSEQAMHHKTSLWHLFRHAIISPAYFMDVTNSMTMYKILS
jgi:hypothetical protein